MEIQHWCHPHPLISSSSVPEFDFCPCCGWVLSCPTYACRTCDFRIHKSCAELPTQINLPLHPSHPLTLHLRRHQDSYSCHACGGRRLCLYYRCSDCHFDLDLACSSLSPAPSACTNEQGSELPHLDHSLILCNFTYKSFLDCSICLLRLDPKSNCVCRLNRPCAELPMPIQHPFHPQHALTILPLDQIPVRQRRRCHACGNTVKRFPTVVTCSLSCYFILHVKCLFLTLTKTAERQQPTTSIWHLGQNHPLFFCDIIHHHGFTHFCSACGLPFEPSITTIYVCTRCKVLLHPSCSKWPLKINHPFHPQHPLILFPGPTNDPLPRCRACECPTRGCRIYRCLMDNCSFSLHVTCASLLPTISSELHQHLLSFCKKESTHYYQRPCKACRRSIKTFYLRCVQCELNWHFRCYPTLLPHKIKHDCHRDPLTLTTSPIKDCEDEGEDAESYCDACEEGRKLAETTYYCAQCHYVAHVDCVLSEVLPVLKASINVVKNENIDEVVRKVCLLEIDEEKQDSDTTPTPTPNERSTAVLLDEDIAALQQQIAEKKVELEALTTKLQNLQMERTNWCLYK